LSEQTEMTLKNLSEPVKFYIFKMEPPKSGNPMVVRQIAEMQQHVAGLEFVLQDFGRKNSHVTYEIVDVQEEPGLVKQYNVREPFIIVAVAGTKNRQIRPDDYISQQYIGGRPQIVPQYEEALTTAIKTLVRQKTWKIVFTSGHQEKDPFGEGQTGAGLLREGLEKEGFNVISTNLVMAGGVPADCDLLVVAGPKDDFLDKEVAYLENYLMQGKPAFFMGERDAG
nr:Gldg family protein [Spirochaetota bacterium]